MQPGGLADAWVWCLLTDIWVVDLYEDDWDGQSATPSMDSRSTGQVDNISFVYGHRPKITMPGFNIWSLPPLTKLMLLVGHVPPQQRCCGLKYPHNSADPSHWCGGGAVQSQANQTVLRSLRGELNAARAGLHEAQEFLVGARSEEMENRKLAEEEASGEDKRLSEQHDFVCGSVVDRLLLLYRVRFFLTCMIGLCMCVWRRASYREYWLFSRQAYCSSLQQVAGAMHLTSAVSILSLRKWESLRCHQSVCHRINPASPDRNITQHHQTDRHYHWTSAIGYMLCRCVSELLVLRPPACRHKSG